MPAAEASEGKTGGDGAPVANDRISVVSADGHEPSARKNRRGSSDDGAKSPKSATSRRRSCDSTASGRGKSLAYGDQSLQEMKDLRDLKAAREKREQELVRKHIENQKDAWRGSIRNSQALRELAQLTRGQLAVRAMLIHWSFDSSMGIVICLNAITIGVESTYTSKDLDVPGWVEVAEYLFLLVYAVELAMRIYVFHLKAFSSRWVVFDAFLVLTGFVEIVAKLIARSGNDILANIMLVRLLRLARLARAARLLVQFRVLWLLVQGLMNSFMTIMWTIVIMVVLVYIFAILGLELLRPDEGAGEDYRDAIQNFDSLGRSMLVLIQFLTLDSAGPIYVAICLEKPHITIYFASYMLIVSISLMNLVTALMVDNAMSQSVQDKEAEQAWEAASKKKAIPKLKEMFLDLDEDGSGCLELEELQNAPEDLKDQLRQIAKMEDCEELFHSLDYDGSGSIDVEEFCDGVLKASQENKPLELLRLARQCTAIHQSTKEALQLIQESWPEGSQGDKADFPAAPRPDAAAEVTDEGGRPRAAEASLGARVTSMELRIAGLDARLGGMESTLQNIADVLVGPANPPSK